MLKGSAGQDGEPDEDEEGDGEQAKREFDFVSNPKLLLLVQQSTVQVTTRCGTTQRWCCRRGQFEIPQKQLERDLKHHRGPTRLARGESGPEPRYIRCSQPIDSPLSFLKLMCCHLRWD